MGSSSSKGGYDFTGDRSGNSELPTYTPDSDDQDETPKQPMQDSKSVGGVVAKVSDLEDGDVKEVAVAGGGKALLIKDSGQFYAVSSKCTHYGAPLEKGAVCNGRLRCQWHGACFNFKTGDIEDFPGLDSLQTYKVDVKNGEVRIHGTEESLSSNKRVKEMTCADPEDKNVFLIIGGGGAASTCAETLRQEGFKGRIIMSTKEASLPYDRPKLSKMLDSKAEKLVLRNKEFYSVYDIEIQCNKEVTKLDTVLKTVTYQDGSTDNFDKVLIATGGSPRKIDLPGSTLENICYLRTPEDANDIAKKIAKKKLVIIGSSFIGLEMAAYAKDKASSVTVLGRGEVPLVNVFGDKVGNMLKEMHKSRGTKFIFNNGAKEFVGGDKGVQKVVLEDGTEVPADVVVVAIGVIPSTSFLDGSGVSLTDRGYLTVNEHMETNRTGIYGAGDIVEFPLFLGDSAQANVQHWQMACKHGHTAALNMNDIPTPLRSVPYFWTMQFGKSIRYAGYGAGFDDITYHGEPEDGTFVAYYTKGPEVVAVATLNSDPIASQAAEMMFAGKKIFKEEIVSSKDSWTSRLCA